MWLINTTSLELEYFVDAESEGIRYAILSHTWGRDQDEVSFQQFTDKQAVTFKPGFAKIHMTCVEAKKDDLDYAWVDTCCIDKSSSAELSEAINSMYGWYRAAAVCYVYLADLDDDEPLRGVPEGLEHMSTTELEPHKVAIRRCPLAKSRWFTRGWTLQELIAPSRQVFYNARWRRFGDKRSLHRHLEVITRIDASVLLDSGQLITRSVWRRMTWAATRDTKRVEDTAYCLLGIFDVNMPLIYGEGYKAFQRLQEEITRKEGDVTILNWYTWEMPEPRHRPVQFRNAVDPPESRGAFAWAPSEFMPIASSYMGEDGEGVWPYREWMDATSLYSPTFRRNDADEFMGRIKAYKLEMGPQSSVVIRCREDKIKAKVLELVEGLGTKTWEYVELPTPTGPVHRPVIFHNLDGFAFRSVKPGSAVVARSSVEREYDNFMILGQHRTMVLEAVKGTRCTIKMNDNPIFTGVWPNRYWSDNLSAWSFTEEQSTRLVQMMAPKVFGILLGHLDFEGVDQDGKPETQQQSFALIVGSDPPRNERRVPTNSGPPRLFGLCVMDKRPDTGDGQDGETLNWVRQQVFRKGANLAYVATELTTRFDEGRFAAYSGRVEAAEMFVSHGEKLTFEIACTFPDAMTDLKQGYWSWQLNVDVRRGLDVNRIE